MTDRIEALRAEIDALDDTIADAVRRRAEIVSALKAEKAARGTAFVDPAREAVIEARYAARLPSIARARVAALVRAVLEACR